MSNILTKLFTIVGMVLIAVTAHAQCEIQTVSYDFEDGLKGWTQNKKSIEVISGDCPGGGNCVKISRKNNRAYTYIAKEIVIPCAGDLHISGMFKVPILVKGKQKLYYRGKFIVKISEEGVDDEYTDNDFRGPITTWGERTLLIKDVDETVRVQLFIGLHKAKGELYVDDVKLQFTPY